MIIRVFPDRIEQRRAAISDYNYSQLPTYSFYDPLIPKYRDDTGAGDPYGQIDRTYEIQSTEDINTPGVETYRKDGY